jgi:pimeloyl-ACP methyl ester carboxylesterase
MTMRPGQSPNQSPEWYEGGSGSTLVLMHGFGGTWRMWKPLLPLLEPHHRVIAATLPGHTGGIALNERASPVSIARAFAEQLKQRGIRDAHFVGQSLGGWCVYEMARFGLARSSLGLSPAGTWRDRQVMAAFMRDARSKIGVLPYLAPLLKLAMTVPALRKRVLANEMEHGERVSAAEARDSLSRTLKMTILKEYFDEHIQPMEPLPADCTTPLRVVWGASDKVLTFDEYGQPLLDLLGLRAPVMLPGCGHNPVFDDTQGVASAILDFTRAVDAGRSVA